MYVSQLYACMGSSHIYELSHSRFLLVKILHACSDIISGALSNAMLIQCSTARTAMSKVKSARRLLCREAFCGFARSCVGRIAVVSRSSHLG